MLHTNSRGEEGIFYKVPGRMGVYTLKKDVGDGVKDLSDCSEDSSEAQSDSQSSEQSNSSSSSASTSSHSGGINQDPRRSRWRRKVASRLSQPSSPPSGCPSPSIPAGKVISPSQKHSKKALKQALKQQQQRKRQQRRPGMPVPSSQHILLKTVKTASTIAPEKSTQSHTWEAKQRDGQSSNAQITASNTSLSARANNSLQGLGKKALQRSDRLQARHIKRTKCAEIDVETPESILVNTNLRALINKHTFSLLPGDCQQRLLLLLPEVDRAIAPDGLMKLNNSALNNEFFTSASQSWKERLSEGEFTPEMQLRIRQEIEKEKRVELWKERFYESYYGENSGLSLEDYGELMEETNEDNIKAQTSLSVEESKPDPCPAAQPVISEEKIPADKDVKEHQPVKSEEEKVIDTTAESSKVTDTIQHPIGSSVEVNVKVIVVSVKTTQMATEGNTDVSVEENIDTTKETTSALALEEPELDSQVSVTPSIPKSPVIVQTPRAVMSKEGLPQDPSKVKSPEKVELGSSLVVKRKLDVGGSNDLHSPEKCPRMMEQWQSPQSFRALCRPSAEPADRSQEQKVPPLKIPVSWLSQKPFLTSRVSPRPGFPATVISPSRTGARTLADIKAKAQLARAQRAAAAAAAAASATSIGSCVPGPGPGGGGAGPGGGQRNPADGIRETGPWDRVLDMGSTGRGRGERGAPPTLSDTQSHREAKNALQTSTHSPARAQLLQKPSLQPRILGNAVGPTSSVISSHFLPAVGPNSTSSMCIKMQNPSPAPGPPETNKGCAGPVTGERPLFTTNTETSLAQNIKGPPAGSTNDSRQRISAIKLNVPSLEAQTTPRMPPVSLREAMSQSNTANVVCTVKPQAAETLSPNQIAGPSITQKCATSGPFTRTGSSIPANNPLVTQLLQGKNVPMEQILPRPLTKVEIKSFPLGSTEKERPPSTLAAPSGMDVRGREDVEKQSNMAAQQLEKFLSQNRQLPSSQRIWQLFSGRDWNSSQIQGQEGFSSVNSEQSLQSLIRRVQEKSMTVSNPSQEGSNRENISTSQRLMFGFVGRRSSKPAMSGHYLLNLSTYGRVPESFRRSHAVSPESSVCLNDTNEEFVDEETESVTESEEEDDAECEENSEEGDSFTVEVEPVSRNSSTSSHQASIRTAKTDAPLFDLKETVQVLTRGNIYDEPNLARDFIQAAQAKMVNVLGVRLKNNASELYKMHTAPPGSQPYPPELLQTSRTYGNPASLIGSSYGGTINISTSPDGTHGSTIPGSGHLGSTNSNNVVSFSVTVTTIPSGVNSGGHEQPVSVQAFTEDSGLETAPNKCYCRLKAMIMCKGCGAFCHDDCIGPSKLCVSCLVVR
ncbi:putative Polycomb group protein ASXL2 [Rhinophrynus dorsalis]